MKFGDTLIQHLPQRPGLFVIWTITLVVAVLAGVILQLPGLIAIPFLMLGIYLAISDFKTVFFMMWACVPLSTELEFSGGFAMDFPVEPLMIVLSGITIVWVLHSLKQRSLAILFHPITIVLLLHIAWISCMVITSTGMFVSVKFLLAKIWYVIPFYFLSYLLFRKERDIRIWFFAVLIPLCATVAVILARHSLEGFSFETINTVLYPFYRNHVDYGLIMGVFFPFVFVLARRWLSRPVVWAICGVLLVAIYFTYTRAAYVGLFVAFAGVLLVRWKLVRHTFIAVVVLAGLAVALISKDNRYIDYAPNYYKTITHQDFSNLLEATYKLEDISTVERFYRWIAAFYMVKEKPLTGFGPNNFVPYYRPYTDEHFITYVSDNEEQSGVHNYFLMTAVEQGIPGLIFFMILLFITLTRIQWVYHRLKAGFHKQLCTAVIGSLFFILFALLLNDVIETDKIGTFFFLNLAFVAIIERNARDDGDWLVIQKKT
jgi:O-antigen ligase